MTLRRNADFFLAESAAGFPGLRRTARCKGPASSARLGEAGDLQRQPARRLQSPYSMLKNPQPGRFLCGSMDPLGPRSKGEMAQEQPELRCN